jgi:hypothetical protein
VSRSAIYSVSVAVKTQQCVHFPSVELHILLSMIYYKRHHGSTAVRSVYCCATYVAGNNTNTPRFLC